MLESLRAQNKFAPYSKSRGTTRRIVSNHSKRILVVDDEPDVTLTLKIGLETHGYVVDAANDPVEGLSYFENNPYDFVIIDIRMPTMDGFEFYRKTQTMAANFGIKAKVCFLTALSIEDYGISLLRGELLPAASFYPLDNENNQRQLVPFIITKPVSIAVLCRLVDEILSYSRLSTVKIKENGQLQEPPTCACCGAWMEDVPRISGRKIMIDGKIFFCNNPSCTPICA